MESLYERTKRKHEGRGRPTRTRKQLHEFCKALDQFRKISNPK